MDRQRRRYRLDRSSILRSRSEEKASASFQRGGSCSSNIAPPVSALLIGPSTAGLVGGSRQISSGSSFPLSSWLCALLVPDKTTNYRSTAVRTWCSCLRTAHHSAASQPIISRFLVLK